ncbi:hypothetical protein BDQ94DRAFT_107966 [Aspergillus welwitschiae]|uniref:Uncharacterized protein n=1 Tax=Aspergillus welwitschiae TaxID=1341132 RepID=A0A3F3PLT4_9EURO|nr:hypothetical protein BDQ94DRAFT_107966 [Aspergillus welwitschiae]RDH27879.1 hypothetical protein BDQ94DRAFT_107966 [Aspergillus welwitschiae]
MSHTQSREHRIKFIDVSVKAPSGCISNRKISQKQKTYKLRITVRKMGGLSYIYLDMFLRIWLWHVWNDGRRQCGRGREEGVRREE